MDAEDLIARVYPNSDEDVKKYAETAIKASSYYVSLLYEEPDEVVQYGRDDRETTEPPEQPHDRKTSKFHGKPYIEIRFSKVPQSSHGLLFGCSNKCDVILPNLKGLSNYHFSLTFDEEGRFIVKDLESGTGTEVTYNNMGKGRRRKFNWIIGGNKTAQRQEHIIIKVDDHVQCQVVAAEHDITCQSYIDNVNKFCQGRATAEDLIHDLDIFRRDTELPTGAHTPGQGPIYVKKKIGKGGFGVAMHCWNVSTGNEFVIKTPSKEVVKKIVKHDEHRKR
ncbi:CAMK family protein kinase [Metarhizium brunneum]